MLGPWDAPRRLRERFAAEEDPDPPTFIEPPHTKLDPDCDPDILFGLQQAYAAQISVLDTCLDVLLDAVWSSAHVPDTVILFMSPRGFPLGEHLWVGVDGAPLHAELLHVPTLIHFPDSRTWAVRARQLAQPCDLFPTLMRVLNLPLEDCLTWGRDLHDVAGGQLDWTGWDRAVACGADEKAIRVPGWYARQRQDEPMALYAKPDDRWEVSNVANRCASETAQLLETIDQFEEAARVGDRDRLMTLPSSLFNDLD